MSSHKGTKTQRVQQTHNLLRATIPKVIEMNEELERIAKDVVDAGMKLHMALGREVTLADREHVDAVYNSIAQEDFSL